MQEDCKVCLRPKGEIKKAFGGRSCPSCRAFFERMIASGKVGQLACASGSGICHINSRSWKSCKKCRLQRCLNLAGMKAAMVGQKYYADNGTAMAHQTVNKFPISCTLPKQVDDNFTVEDSHFMMKMYHGLINIWAESICELGVAGVEWMCDTLINGKLMAE